MPAMMSDVREFKFCNTYGPVYENNPNYDPKNPDDSYWLLPEHSGYESIGYEVIDWLQFWLSPIDGVGDNLVLTPEQCRFFIWWYAVDPATDHFVYNDGTFVRIKGSGKDPIAAMLSLVELVGPCRLAGWTADGRPVGRDNPTAWVQLAGVNKEQNGNTLKFMPILASERFKSEYGFQYGIEKSYAMGRARVLEAVAGNPAALEGNRPSCVIRNEVHWWAKAKNDGFELYAVCRRNLSKRGESDPGARGISFTNAYNPSIESVARNAREAYMRILEGTAIDTGIFYDSIEVRDEVPIFPKTGLFDADGSEVPPTDEVVRDNLIDILSEVRGDAFWLSPAKTALDILDPQVPLSDSRRFFLNQVTTSEESWLLSADIMAAISEDVQTLRDDPTMTDKDRVGWMQVNPSDPVVLFFDGSKNNDSTAIVGCRVSDMYCFLVGVWERPIDKVKAKAWTAPRGAIDARMDEAMRRFNVVACWADPSHTRDDDDYSPYWDGIIDGWHTRYSDQLVLWAKPAQHAVMWDMTSPMNASNFVAAAEKAVEDFESLDVQFDGHPRLVAHLKNAQQRDAPKQGGVTLGKKTRNSPDKIDAAVCLVGARMLARLVSLSGATEKKLNGYW
jgi:hypothetical protein